jgi:hypothetical protein
MLTQTITRGAQQAPLKRRVVSLEIDIMNLQRISDFAENQEGRSFFFNKTS